MITDKQREVFLATLQEQAPRQVPTAQFHAKQRPGGVTYYPMNPAARSFTKLAGVDALPPEKLGFVRDLGYRIELLDGSPVPHPYREYRLCMPRHIDDYV